MIENIIHIRIPAERIGILIGSKGSAKNIIQKKFKINLEINGKTGEVDIIFNSKLKDPSDYFRARDIIMAIGRGFSPEKAFRLLNEDITFGIIDLRDYFKNDSDIQRIKGRIIGKNGKTRMIIEELTGANISVYGHTISILGEHNQFEVAREAIELLIQGKLHKSVYGFLQRKRSDLKKEELELWKTPLSGDVER